MNDELKIKLFATNPIKNGGKVLYKKEFTVDDEEQARALIDAGSAADVDGYFNADEGVDGVSEPETDSIAIERIKVIKDAILKLNPDTKSHWDENSKPALKALAKAAGGVITEEERDTVYSLIND